MTTYTIPPNLREGDNYLIVHWYDKIEVVDPNGGPCTTCDKPMARLRVVQHTWHNGYAYASHYDWFSLRAVRSN